MFLYQNTMTTKCLLEPEIHMDNYTLSQALKLVEIVPTECQWFHLVDRVIEGNKLIYKLSEIFIPEQTVTASTVDSDPAVWVQLANEVKTRTGGYNDEFNSIIQRLTCWVHSHVKMPTVPSGTDVTQFELQCNNGLESSRTQPQIMMIFNKDHKYYSKVVDPELNAVFENVPIRQIFDYDFSYIEEAKEKKIVQKKFEPTITTSIGSHTSSPYGNVIHHHNRHGNTFGHGSAGLRNATNDSSHFKKAHQETTKTHPANPGTQTGRTPQEVGLLTTTSGTQTPVGVQSYVKTYELAPLFVEDNAVQLVNGISKIHELDRPSLQAQLIKAVMNILTGTLSKKQIAMTYGLLAYDQKEFEERLELWYFVDDENTYDDSDIELEEYLSAFELDPPEQILEVIQAILMAETIEDKVQYEQYLLTWFEEHSTNACTEDDEEEEEAEEEAHVDIGIGVAGVSGSYNTYVSKGKSL